jgi:hypothetical protein
VLLAASFIPVVASIVMGYIAATELGAACKLCIGIYVASAIVFVSAIWVRAAVKNNDHERAPTSASFYGLAAAQLLAFVAIPVIVYATLVPDFSRYIGTCGALKDSSDPQKIQVPLRADSNKTPAIEILDPLCPACRAFERRLEASGLHDELARKVVLFPLDSACNWMIETSLHPGACSISEAMLCADRNDAVSPADVLAWAFEHQEQVIAAAKTDAQVPAQMVTQAFPALKECVGSATVRARLNKSLRWAVTNQLPVMTPQLYIDGVKLCDEDTDLGLEWMLSRMIERHSAGTLQAHKAGEGQ